MALSKREARTIVRRCRRDPVFFCEHVLGVHLWHKQKEIIRSIRDNAYTCVASGHGVGKSFLSACATLWFLFCFKDSRVITTAPTNRQVEAILWAEIHHLYKNSKAPLGGRLLKVSLTLEDKWYALGLSTDDPDRFVGHHAKHLLLVMDEAPGIDPTIYEASKGILTSIGARALLIGNPTSSSGPFFDCFSNKMWTKFHISCYDSPGVTDPVNYPTLTTQKWIDERKEEWGEASPMFQSRVLGRFPEEGDDILIPLVWCEEAARRGIRRVSRQEGEISDRVYLGLDVARYGTNRTVLTTWIPNTVKRIKSVQSRDTMEAVRLVIAEAVSAGSRLMKITVDDTGLGCVAEGTLILTPTGPTPVERLKVGDKIFSKDMSVETIEHMYSHKCDVLNRGGIEFAPGHFMKYKTRRDHKEWLPLSWDNIINKKSFYLDTETVTTQKEKPFVLSSYKHLMPNGGYKTTSKKKTVDAKRFAEFLGWFISEGHIDGRAVGITQKGECKDVLETTLRALPFKYTKCTDKVGTTVFKIHSKALVDWLKINCYVAGDRKDFYTKNIPGWVYTNSKETIETFLNTFVLGGGYVRRGRRHYITYSPTLLNGLLALEWSMGHAASYCVKQLKGSIGTIEGREFHRTCDSYCIYQTREDCVHVNSKKQIFIKEGRVYKLEISGDSKLFPCMFKDKIFWTHNGGVTDRLRELNYPVVGINFSQKPTQPLHFRGIRDEMYWNLREMFRSGEIIIPNNDILIAQISSIKYRINPRSGKIEIETKDDMGKRGLKSPDEADSLVLAVWGARTMHASSSTRQRVSSSRNSSYHDIAYY